MKKFIVSADALRPALKKLALAINEKSVLPITKNIYVNVEKNQVELIATDQELTISCTVEAETGEGDGFEMLVPFDYLNKLVSVIKSQPMVFEHPSVRRLNIICENEVYEQSSLDKFEDFPKLPSKPKKFQYKLGAEFGKLLATALHTCGKDNIRPAMTRVLMDITDQSAFLVSTDTYVMYKYRVALESNEAAQLQFSAKMIKAMEGMEQFELSWNEKKVCINSDKVTIWATNHTDRYPNYNAVIPDYHSNLELDKDLLIDQLHKACITSNSAKQTNIILNKAGKVHFETDDPDYSRKIKTVIEASYTGSVEKISVNAKKMLTVLEQAPAQVIRLHIHAATKAILISSADDENYLGLVMPLIG